MTSHRFEPIHNRHHDVSSAVPLEIEEVDGADGPKVDAGDPWQDRELETLWQVWPVCVKRLIGHLQGRHAGNRMSYQAGQRAARTVSEPSDWPPQDSETKSHCSPTQQMFRHKSVIGKGREKISHTWQTSLTSSVKEYERMKVPDILPLKCASYLSTLLLNYATELTILCWSTQNGSQHLWKNGTWLFLIVPICPISNAPASPLIIR